MEIWLEYKQLLMLGSLLPFLPSVACLRYYLLCLCETAIRWKHEQERVQSMVFDHGVRDLRESQTKIQHRFCRVSSRESWRLEDAFGVPTFHDCRAWSRNGKIHARCPYCVGKACCKEREDYIDGTDKRDVWKVQGDGSKQWNTSAPSWQSR